MFKIVSDISDFITILSYLVIIWIPLDIWKTKANATFAVFTIKSLLVSMPTGFFIWGYMYPFTFIFGGAISNSSFGGTKKINCIFSTQGRAPCCFFCKYYTELTKTFFFCLTLGQTGSGVLSDPWLCVCPTIFFVILYITCQILFFIQNSMQDYLYIVMIIKQLN